MKGWESLGGTRFCGEWEGSGGCRGGSGCLCDRNRTRLRGHCLLNSVTGILRSEIYHLWMYYMVMNPVDLQRQVELNKTKQSIWKWYWNNGSVYYTLWRSTEKDVGASQPPWEIPLSNLFNPPQPPVISWEEYFFFKQLTFPSTLCLTEWWTYSSCDTSSTSVLTQPMDLTDWLSGLCRVGTH